MKYLSAIAAAVVIAGSATAQTVTQQGEATASGNATYSVQVTGSNGITYNCLPNITTVNGVRARQCVQAGGGGLTNAGAGIGAAAPAVGLAVVAIAVAAGGGSSSTTGTP